MTTPTIHEERQRLLMLIKKATDHYELGLAEATHFGYLLGLRESGVVGSDAFQIYLDEGTNLANSIAELLTLKVA